MNVAGIAPSPLYSLALELQSNIEEINRTVSKRPGLLHEFESARIAPGQREVGKVNQQPSERRHGARLWVNLPVLVYGRTIESEPFHEGTEALRVNAGGGLITLTSPVRCGQRLILINKVNHKEHECHVVAERSKYLQRTAVVIGFQEPVPDFWTGIDDGDARAIAPPA
jgi:hypothetical protein